MKINRESPALRFVKKNALLLLILLLGLTLLLLPSGKRERETEKPALTEAEERLAAQLGRMEGVGEVYVLLAEKSGREGGFDGAVIVCEGAQSSAVRLRIVQVTAVFTGLGSDKIVVQKISS